ncbi:MAG TPA: ATP-binding protein [Phycisphaerales bacterium]|nr:ATP-binding protein [Phycisphaerales bacterium]HRQ76459.1 ATP-binding protein [Phycisphaerales bacterium]
MGELGTGAPAMKLELLSQPRLLSAARALVSTFAQRLGFDEILCGQITLAVDEALCNIINHGYGRREDQPIWMSIWAVERDEATANGQEAGLRIVLEDNARQVDPSTIRSRNLEDVRPGGLGVYIMREIMDEVLFEKREGQGMRLTLVKRFDSTRPHETEGAEASEGGGRR